MKKACMIYYWSIVKWRIAVTKLYKIKCFCWIHFSASFSLKFEIFFLFFCYFAIRWKQSRILFSLVIWPLLKRSLIYIFLVLVLQILNNWFWTFLLLYNLIDSKFSFMLLWDRFLIELKSKFLCFSQRRLKYTERIRKSDVPHHRLKETQISLHFISYSYYTI